MKQLQVFEGYSAKINKILETPVTYRGIEQYALMLGFLNKNIFLDSLPIGSRILDIGSGEEGLRGEMSLERPDLEVFSINPSLVKRMMRQNHGSDWTIIAINPELPIEDGAFDVAIDQMASVYYSQGSSEQSTQDHLFEIARVLKRGGKAYVGPTLINPGNDYEGRGRVGRLLDNIRSISWKKKEFSSPSIDILWRSYHIGKI